MLADSTGQVCLIGETKVGGAIKPDFQPGEGRWTVLADPEGHLFCITTA